MLIKQLIFQFFIKSKKLINQILGKSIMIRFSRTMMSINRKSTHLDSRITKQTLQGKGAGLVAKKFIPKNTTIIKEYPTFSVDGCNEIIVSDMFQLLYQILNDCDKEKISSFKKLLPKTVEKFVSYQNKINAELEKLNTSKTINIYKYFKESHTSNELLLLCAKYMCNAFTYGNGGAILFTGTLLNHSCLPNVIFGKKGNCMHFITVRDIEPGEELLDHYIDLTLNKKERQLSLLNQYGFECKCTRCNNSTSNHTHDLTAKEIMQLKRRLF